MPTCSECQVNDVECTGRCKSCSTLKTRMRRLSDTHVLDSIAALDKARRVDGIQTKHELMGADLKSELNALVEE